MRTFVLLVLFCSCVVPAVSDKKGPTPHIDQYWKRFVSHQCRNLGKDVPSASDYCEALARDVQRQISKFVNTVGAGVSPSVWADKSLEQEHREEGVKLFAELSKYVLEKKVKDPLAISNQVHSPLVSWMTSMTKEAITEKILGKKPRKMREDL